MVLAAHEFPFQYWFEEHEEAPVGMGKQQALGAWKYQPALQVGLTV
jgi:hypothetical protein